uniref:Uncharacterized protein n=1 Tax=Timema tahoe TaxID=61484 RepID=A0A7R9INJ6_9NEOP|nr:unnamed protein product [Timema tahoe]
MALSNRGYTFYHSPISENWGKDDSKLMMLKPVSEVEVGEPCMMPKLTSNHMISRLSAARIQNDLKIRISIFIYQRHIQHQNLSYSRTSKI